MAAGGACSGGIPTVHSCVPTQVEEAESPQANAQGSASHLALPRPAGLPLRARSLSMSPSGSGDADFRTEVHVLNRVQQFGALRHRSLERLAATDQAHTAGALVDHCGNDRLTEVVLA